MLLAPVSLQRPQPYVWLWPCGGDNRVFILIYTNINAINVPLMSIEFQAYPGEEPHAISFKLV